MNSIINPQDTLANAVDQTIDEQYIDRMEGMDRISDVLRSLREFSGNKLSCLEVGQEALQLLTQTYRDKALDTFVRGLRVDLPRLLGMKEPADLLQALHLCLKLQNQNFRTSYANNVNYGEKGTHIIPPLPPRRRHNNNFNRPMIPFRQQFKYVSRYQGNIDRPNYNRDDTGRFNSLKRTQPPNIPPRPNFPRPPEAMEVDRSIRTAVVNYANRPRTNFDNFRGKRFEDYRNLKVPNGVQRNYHVNTEQHEYDLRELIPQRQTQGSVENTQTMRMFIFLTNRLIRPILRIKNRGG